MLEARALTQEQEKALDGPPAAGQRDPPRVARPRSAVRGQVRRPGQPAGHARRGPQGPPRGDGPRRLDRHRDGPLGLPARPFRRPGLGPPRRLRQGRRPGRRRRKGSRRSLRAELNPETTRGKAGPLAESLARQRLDPLKGHLAGIKRLIVVNSPGLAGVPVEVLLAARPDPAWDAITVSYAPSASMFAYLAGRPVPRDRPATLLAVADPAYPRPEDDAPAPEPPAAGLAVARVVPNGNADLNGLREGDVLLSYAGTELKQAGDLKPVASDGGPKKVPGAILARGDHPRGRARRRAAGRRHRPPPGRRRSSAPAASPSGSCWGCAAGRTPGCPAPAARSRPSPHSSPTGEPPPSWAPKPARRPCRAWPARGSSRATATSTSPPTASPTPASPTARP